MALPSERVRASKGGYLSSLCCFQPKPVFGEPQEVAASVAEGGKLLLKADGDDGVTWCFELYADAQFLEVEESGGADGAKVPSLHCSFSKAGRRDDPTKLHFGSVEERSAWKEALTKARDEAARA
jgi:hypothetical protein